MKKATRIISLAFIICFLMMGCSNKPEASAQAQPESDAQEEQSDSADTSDSPQDKASSDDSDISSGKNVDLTVLSSTMVYSEVYNMMVTPEEYIGGTIKMKGQFAVYEDTIRNKNYYVVSIADATACCQQGFEFVLAGDYQYPDDYPEQGTEITVTGTFQTYEEDGYEYCHLIDGTMEINE